MVASARLAAGLTGLRNRNTRVTNKTQLHIVKGSIEADPIILDDDDDEKNRILASQGVDEEDANVSLVVTANGSCL
jgi:enhancer of polycomb-like protein